MKTEQKIAAAKECFLADKEGKFEELYVTSDGQVCVNKHYAEQHQVEVDKKEKVFTVKRDDLASDNEKEYAHNAKKTIELIKEAQDVNVINDLVAGDDRSTVLDAAEKRIKELTEGTETGTQNPE